MPGPVPGTKDIPGMDKNLCPSEAGGDKQVHRLQTSRLLSVFYSGCKGSL